MIGHNVLMIEIQALPADRLSIIAEIDRSEHVDTLLEARAGELTSRPVDIEVPRWTSEGSGPESVEGFIGFLGPILERGATLLGAFDQEHVAGVAIVQERFEGDMAWLVFLHVTNAYRRQGVGSALWNAAIDRARSAGSQSIYASATPSASAVGFYLERGCEVVRVPHRALHAEEPDDIHLIAAID